VIVVLVVVTGLRAWSVPVYALTPGNATPVGPLVRIHGVATDPHHDKIMLTDVFLQSLSAWQWLTMHFESHVQFVPANELIDPGVPADELGPQGFLQMNDSKQAAEVAAFRALGWTVPSTHSGVIVNAVVAPSPARSAGVHVADDIVAVDATPVSDTCALIGRVHAMAPGTSVRLRVARAVISSTGVISYKKPSTVTVKTAVAPKGLQAPACPGITGSGHSWLGVGLEDGIVYTLPATVSIDTSNIGGPSAGLAMTLTLIDRLSEGSLTGHQVVAATGTIDAEGNVGDVGGVSEKTVAAQRAGVKYFIVPQVEVATARRAASPGLKIIGVTTLAQALGELRAIGGASPVALTTPH
jgi:PDZ domain-containing protein